MKKYIYQCDSCGNKWKDLNPEECPQCQKEDFHIDSEVKGKKALIFIIACLMLSVSGFLLWYFSIQTSVTTYIVSYDRTESGVIKVITEPKIDDFEKFDFSFKNLTTDKEVKRIENNLYPCESGEIIFSFKIGEEIENIQIIEEQSIGVYTLKEDINGNLKYHPESGCGEAPRQLRAKVKYDKSKCRYIVVVTDENNKKETKGLEISWGSENNWEKNVLQKKFDQVKQPFDVFVRYDNNIIIKATPYEKVAQCKPQGCKPNCIDFVQSTFSKWKKDVCNDDLGSEFSSVGKCSSSSDNIDVSYPGGTTDIDSFVAEACMGLIDVSSYSVADVVYSSNGGCEVLSDNNKIKKIIFN